MIKYHAIAKPTWGDSCVHSECTLHQLSPYIGKLKSSIAKDLIVEYSKPADLVIDPFSGSGTIPLEAKLLGRRVFASDISPYSIVLTGAKLFAPENKQNALDDAERLLGLARKIPPPEIESVPNWVRLFFHPQTLGEIINLSNICIAENNYFIIACLLGILHHQRPGFLSYPSSHLVPYLRDKKFPKKEYPELYEYRSVDNRLYEKINRAYRRVSINNDVKYKHIIMHQSIRSVNLPEKFDCLITSPPYMNTLNYGRDNRLRLWFLNGHDHCEIDKNTPNTSKSFESATISLAIKTEIGLKKNGHCIVIVGESIKSNQDKLSILVSSIFEKNAPSLKLKSIIVDTIPDIRRTRKNCKNTKKEHILIFEKR